MPPTKQKSNTRRTPTPPTKQKSNTRRTPTPPTKQNVNGFFKAIDECDVNKVQDMLKNNRHLVNSEADRWNPLTRAASYKGCIEIVKLLLKYGADINQRDGRDGRTPLTTALEDGKDKIAKFLLEAGADPNKADNDDITAMYIAVYNNVIPLAKLLLKHGADINKRVKGDNTLMQIAIRENHFDMAKLLVKENPKLSPSQKSKMLEEVNKEKDMKKKIKKEIKLNKTKEEREMEEKRKKRVIKEKTAKQTWKNTSRTKDYDYTTFYQLGRYSRRILFEHTWLVVCGANILPDYIVGVSSNPNMNVMGFREKKNNEIISIIFYTKPTKTENYYYIHLLCANRRYIAAGKRLMEAFENRNDIKSGVEIRLRPANQQLHKYYGSIGYSDMKSGKEMTKTIIKDTPTRN
jgi:ankyrin repeat protein